MRMEFSRMKLAGRMTSVAFVMLCLLWGGAMLPAEAFAASANGGAGAPDGDAPHTVVILVRHAEKATDDPKDPSLSAAGVKRAQALAKMLEDAGVTHLFASEYRRTRDTLAPLAARLGKKVLEVPAGDPEQQVAAVRGLPAGAVAVVAGHSNTVPQLVELLGGEVSGLVETDHGPMIDDDTYDRLFLMILPAAGSEAPVKRGQTVELRYGD